MDAILQGKDADDWFYKGEGAANVVLGYGGSLPHFFGKVLRLRKVSRSQPMASGDLVFPGNERLLWKDLEEIAASSLKESISQLYVQQIMSPLLGSQYVDAGLRLLVSQDFLELVEKNIHNQRPAWCINAAKINKLCDSALLISDQTLFPHGSPEEDVCIAVEIKPKCGFLPSSGFIAKENSIKRRVSHFRMLQGLKRHQGEILQVSKYDPLDLFSGSIDRINHAINALFANPQNYFRIFLNGSLIFGGLGGAMEDAELASDQTNEVINVFEEKIKVFINAEHGNRSQCLLELISKAIFESEMLNQVLEVQKLDSLNIEGAIHAYYDVTSQPCMVCNNLNDSELINNYAYLHSLPLEESVKIVREYLIAATAKDCSVMISFRKRLEGSLASPYSSIHLESTKQNFDYKACFIDLDMKPLGKMIQHYELDQKILRFYSHTEKIENVFD